MLKMHVYLIFQWYLLQLPGIRNKIYYDELKYYLLHVMSLLSFHYINSSNFTEENILLGSYWKICDNLHLLQNCKISKIYRIILGICLYV